MTNIIDSVSLKDLPKILPKLSEQERRQLLFELEALDAMKQKELQQKKFIPFVKSVWPTFIAGRHHARMAEAFERVARGECKRLIINMPPRHTKSEFASYLLPAWFLGKFPHKKVIQASHTAELAVGFGRKVRNLVLNVFVDVITFIFIIKIYKRNFGYPNFLKIYFNNLYLNLYSILF